MAVNLMRRERLLELKQTARKMAPTPDRDMVHALINHGLSALDVIDGGPDQKAIERGYAERERQVKLAIADVLAEAADPGGDTNKVIYMLECIQEMLRAKQASPAWTREWSYYQPRIEEEFS